MKMFGDVFCHFDTVHECDITLSLKGMVYPVQ